MLTTIVGSAAGGVPGTVIRVVGDGAGPSGPPIIEKEVGIAAGELVTTSPPPTKAGRLVGIGESTGGCSGPDAPSHAGANFPIGETITFWPGSGNRISIFSSVVH